jgi:hypothetical protein
VGPAVVAVAVAVAAAVVAVAAAVVVVAAAAASDAAAAVGFDFGVGVGVGVGDNAAAETRPVQIRRAQGLAQTHSRLVACGPHILHDRCAHCKNHDEAAKEIAPDLFHDSVPIHVLAEDGPRVSMSQHVLSHRRVQNHIQSL